MEVKSLPKQLIALTINLTAGLKLVTNRKLTPRNFIYSIDQALWLIALLFCLEITVTYLVADKPASFSSYGLNYLGAIYLVDILILLTIARIAHATPAVMGRLILAYLASVPLITITSQILSASTFNSYDKLLSASVTSIAIILWYLYVLTRLLRIILELTPARSLYLASLGILFTLSSVWFLPQTQLWYSDQAQPSDSSYEKLYRLSIEDLFYDQYPLVDDALNGLAPQRPGVADLYLVTMGGYGLENVFRNEVEYVRELFDNRFDTVDRSMILVNNIDTLSTYPLANRHNLSDSLSIIGKIMDPSEDVLFLFMTSHGSKEHKFSVNFGPIPLDNISPTEVRQALDDAGILWRVIVVSSCYSGGFIESLRTPHSLIITAADKDRQSFGCGAKSEFTDFGTAYFKHALNKQPDFIKAFDIAAKWVEDKERVEHRKHSLPQRFVGNEIGTKLTQLSWMRYNQSISYQHTNESAECNSRSSAISCRTDK
jgi:hypothetical protein